MKKNRFSRTRQFLKRIFNVREWSDWDRMRGYTQYIIRGAKRLFLPQTASTKKTFEEIQAKMNLSSQDLQDRQKALLRLSLIMAGMALLLLGYAIYQLLWGNVSAFLLSFVIMLLALVLAFRYNYWHYLIKKKKLDCTLNEWFRQSILGDKNE